MTFYKRVFIGIIVLVFAAVSAVIFFRKFLPDTNKVPNLGIFEEKSIAPESTEQIIQHNLSPIASNQWYSSVYKKFPTQSLYTFPLAYQLSPEGLSFSSPEIKATDKTIFAPFVEDFAVGFADDLEKPKIESIGDWSIGFSMATKQKDSLSFTLAHGIPYIKLKIDSDSVHVRFAHDFVITDQNTTKITSSSFSSDSYLVTTNNHEYIFVLPQKSAHTVKKNEIIIGKPGSLFIGLLDKKDNYDLFKEISDIEILGTSATPTVETEDLVTIYKTVTNGKVPLITLFSHQSDFLTQKPDILGTYPTLRGDMELVSANSFTTRIPLVRPDESFKKVSKGESEIIVQLKKDIKEVIEKGSPDSKNYYLGTWFGKVTSLIQLTDTFKLTAEKETLLQFVEPIFTKSLTYFQYDSEQKSLVSTSPEFGNEKLNDHHFHYGYYIRTAAVLARYKPELLKDYKGLVDELVNDIATIDRNSETYPYLRNFDVYEGHSWADGYADFVDGNNQESSSEAINAWYAVYLWSKVTKNVDLEKYALYLYNTEIQSVYDYWFDKKNNYAAPYGHKIASIVWGGKVDFTTWFGKEANMIYGIQLLPITPASLYLGNLDNFSQYEEDYRKSGGDGTKEWGELFIIWKSFYDPKEALEMKDKVTKPHSDTPRSLFLYVLYMNQK